MTCRSRETGLQASAIRGPETVEFTWGKPTIVPHDHVFVTWAPEIDGWSWGCAWKVVTQFEFDAEYVLSTDV
jgi:hypothetical protein